MAEEHTAGLIADIGGTRARFALVEADGAIGHVEVLKCRDHATLADAVAAYLDTHDHEHRRNPRRAALAVACPVTGDVVAMTNHVWTFSIKETRTRLGFETLTVINDFGAVARAVPHLDPATELLQVGGGAAVAGTPKAVLGPGTGLGVSGLVPTGDEWAVIEGEGGHGTMAAVNDRESAVLAELREMFGHVSAERVLSGPGLVNLHAALCRLAGEEQESGLEPRDIAERGLADPASRCCEALDLACGLLGTFAASLALTLGARGGVYIGGGIVRRYPEAFAASKFRTRFESRGRFSDYLANIPTYVILHEFPAFPGLAPLVHNP